jgi:hypothetical protein
MDYSLSGNLADRSGSPSCACDLSPRSTCTLSALPAHEDHSILSIPQTPDPWEGIMFTFEALQLQESRPTESPVPILLAEANRKRGQVREVSLVKELNIQNPQSVRSLPFPSAHNPNGQTPNKPRKMGTNTPSNHGHTFSPASRML